MKAFHFLFGIIGLRERIEIIVPLYHMPRKWTISSTMKMKHKFCFRQKIYDKRTYGIGLIFFHTKFNTVSKF